MKKKLIPLYTLFFIILVYYLGPTLPSEELSARLPDLKLDVSMAEKFVADNESKYDIKPDNEARIVWNNDSLKNKTAYSILYLHGFTASWYEGYPTHMNLAEKFHANLFLSRLYDHGIITDDPLLDMEPSKLYESAKEALFVAAALGDKVIVMGTSTGATLALKLAADFPGYVEALVLLSPNIEINNKAAFMLHRPWGLQVARFSDGGGKYRILEPESSVESKYWYTTYRWEATVYLGQLVQQTMNNDLFKQVTQPLFLGYYYKNEDEQDEVVKVDAMHNMYEQVSTPNNWKHKVAFPNAGDHVIASDEKSGCASEVEKEIALFIDKIIE